MKVEGLNVIGLEGDPFDMTPIKEYGSRKTSAALREKTIHILTSKVKKNIRSCEQRLTRFALSQNIFSKKH